MGKDALFVPEGYRTDAAGRLRQPPRMAGCHPHKLHYARDLCHACYEATRRTKPGMRAKAIAVTKNWLARHPEKQRDQRNKHTAQRRLARSGVTQEMYDEALKKQGGRCAICPATEPGNGRKSFCADHDHITGKFRGLLCVLCNVGIGWMRDDPTRLRAAADYLEKSR